MATLVQNYWDEFLTLIGGIAAIANIFGVVALLFLKVQYKKVLAAHKHGLDTQLAVHEAELRAKHEKEIAVLRIELEQTAAQRQLMFSRIYEKREEIIRALYPKLREALDACVSATASVGGSGVDDAIRKMRAMHTEFELVSIYFTEDFSQKWHEKVDAVATSLHMLDYAHKNQTKNAAEDYARASQAFEKCVTAFRGVTGELRRQLRVLIGVQEPSKL
jgi:hypothetical protein